jgi:hypothetical protein
LKSETIGSQRIGAYWENITLIPASNIKFQQEENTDTVYSFSDTTYVDSNPVYMVICTGEHFANESSSQLQINSITITWERL